MSKPVPKTECTRHGWVASPAEILCFRHPHWTGVSCPVCEIERRRAELPWEKICALASLLLGDPSVTFIVETTGNGGRYG